MNKVNIVAIILAVVLLGVNIGQAVHWHNSMKDLNKKYADDIAARDLKIQGFGDEVVVYTVTEAKKPGDQIKEKDLQELTTYSSMVTEQYVQDTSTIIDKFFKIGINPGTPILSNMIMDEEIDATARIHDVALDSLTVGLEEGDYIDIRMTLPYGDDYVVIPHKRIYRLGEETIQLYLTELEWNTYLGAMVDYFLNKEYGCSIYGTKYIEPGIQPDAVAYYAVPSNISALLQKNPNIVDKEEAASLNEWRASLEDILVIFRKDEDTVESDASRLSSARSSYNEGIETDRATEKQEREQAEEEAKQEAAEAEETGDDYWDEEPAGDEAESTEEGQ